jgi:hypothetical protein
MMHWKSYAAASGATVLAGWLASAPPAAVSENRAVSVPRARRAVATAPSSDIAEQAARLQARVRREMAYTRPQRNLFQFDAERPAVVASTAPEAVRVPVEAPARVLQPAVAITLAGLAEDAADQGGGRTAILSSSAGVLLVRTGDDVLGQYRVGVIEAESVELVSVADGSTLRLSLAGSANP